MTPWTSQPMPKYEARNLAQWWLGLGYGAELRPYFWHGLYQVRVW